MGYPCDDCGVHLDTNISTYEYHLVATGLTHICGDCRTIRGNNGTFVWSWMEGWKRPKGARLYHYYEGKVWDGGAETRASLCKRSSYPHRDLVHGHTIPDGEKCKRCLELFLIW